MKRSKMVTVVIIGLTIVLAMGAIGFVREQQASATIGNGNTGNSLTTSISHPTRETANATSATTNTSSLSTNMTSSNSSSSSK